jgi:hypothetical protein
LFFRVFRVFRGSSSFFAPKTRWLLPLPLNGRQGGLPYCGAVFAFLPAERCPDMLR